MDNLKHNKPIERQPQPSSSSKKIDSFTRHWSKLTDQANSPTTDINASPAQQRIERLSSHRETQSSDQNLSQEYNIQLHYLETRHRQKTQELSNLLQNVNLNTIQDIHTKIEECIQDAGEILQLTTNIYIEKITTLDKIQEKISDNELARNKLEIDITQETHIKHRINDYYNKLNDIKSSDTSDILQQLFLSQDEARLNNQINALKKELNNIPNLETKYEEKKTLFSEFESHKKKLQDEITPIYQKIQQYNKHIETWVDEKENIERHLVSKSIFKSITFETIESSNTNTQNMETSSEEAESTISTEPEKNEIHEKMWEIIHNVRSYDRPFPTELSLTDQENTVDMMARHLAYSFFMNPESTPTKKAKITTTKGKEAFALSGIGLLITPAQEKEYVETAQRILGGKEKIRKIGPESDAYNCHGRTFAKRFGHIMDDDVSTLLEDYKVILTSNDLLSSDKLQQIPLGDPIPPIIIYADNAHSGDISRIENGKIYFIAKDGPYGEYELEVNDYPTLHSLDDKSWKIYRWPNQISTESMLDPRETSTIANEYDSIIANNPDRTSTNSLDPAASQALEKLQNLLKELHGTSQYSTALEAFQDLNLKSERHKHVKNDLTYPNRENYINEFDISLSQTEKLIREFQEQGYGATSTEEP